MGALFKIAGVAVLAFVAFFTLFASFENARRAPARPQSPTASSPEPTDREAYFAAQEFVLRALKAPSTAKFKDCAHVVSKESNGSWTVILTVDAQNSFGAVLRQSYTVSGLRHTANDQTWHLDKPVAPTGFRVDC